jgi:hypothetical protein
MLRYAIGLVALLTIFSSCKTNIDLIGDFEEKALVYGLLDPNDNPSNGGAGHFIRIQRSFLGEASAFDMAMIPDSSYFDYNTTTVEIHRITISGLDTNILESWQLDTVNTQMKEDGVFFGPEQRLYHWDDDVIAGRTYMLEINNTATGYRAMSVMDMMDDTDYRWNKPNENFIGNFTGLNLKRTDGTYFDFNTEFNTADNASKYELWLRFYYREVTGTDTVFNELNWNVGRNNFSKTDGIGIQNGNFVLSGEQVFSFIGSNLEPPASGVTRLIGKSYNTQAGNGNKVGPEAFELVMYIAGSDYTDFLDVTGGNTAGLTEAPRYSNIENGIGVFSCRTRKVFPRLVPNDSDDLQEFIAGQYTGDLQFQTDQ